VSAAQGPRRARSPGRRAEEDSEDSEPCQPCECECGELAPPGRRTVDEVHATRIRVRRCRDRKRVDRLDPAAEAVERELEQYERRRAEIVSEVPALSGGRARAEVLANRRHEIWSRLPDANGDGVALRVELDQLTRRLYDEWEAVRMVEAVTR
jgi:hypothetical protein